MKNVYLIRKESMVKLTLCINDDVITTGRDLAVCSWKSAEMSNQLTCSLPNSSLHDIFASEIKPIDFALINSF